MKLTLLAADGLTPLSTLNFGVVTPGQSASLGFAIQNTSATPAQGVSIGVVTVGDADLEAWLSGDVGGQAFTASARLPLPDLAPGASISGTLSAAVPLDIAGSALPLTAGLSVRCYQDD